jgi:flagellar hook protein FlgE
MSLYGAMLTGVSALDANSRALNISSSNIANVNTIGYKTSTGAFSTFLASSIQAGQVSPAGVHVGAVQNVTEQGQLVSTGSATDLAMSGNGFFVVTSDPTATNPLYAYTRAGSFAPDANGLLRNTAGYYLEGWQLDANGAMPTNRSALTAVNLGALNGTASPTSTMNLQANLEASTTAVTGYTAGDMASSAVTPAFEQTINVYDSLGGSRPMKLSFVKIDTPPNSWGYEVSYEGNLADIGSPSSSMVGSGTITFNSDGTLQTPASASFTVPWDNAATGLNSQAIDINFGTIGKSDGVTQFDAASAMTTAGVNGAPSGALAGISIDEEGFVTALFDNGIQQKVYKLPIATFTNPNGLSALPGNAYALSDTSGAPAIVEAKTSGAGAIASAALEASTVDLAKEFTDLITTQRAYSAATRIITTADDMMQELLQIKN